MSPTLIAVRRSTFATLTGVCAALWLMADHATAQDQGAPPAPAPPATLATTTAAPGAYRLTLDDAKSMALSNNSQLELGRLNVQAKELAIRAAQTDYFPKILGTYDAVHFNDGLGTVVTTPGRVLPLKTIAVDVYNQNSSFGMITVAQPITQLIGVSALVDIARAERNVAAAKLEQGTVDLMSGITQAYYGLLAARRIQMALTLQVQMVEPLLKEKPSSELRLGLLEARSGLVEVNKQIAELTDTLDQLLGIPPGTELEVFEPALPPVTVGSADEAAALALANNPQVCEAEQNILKAHAGIKAAKMDCLPTVDILGGYVNQDIQEYVQSNIGFVGVTANYTLLDWGKRRDVMRQRETELMMANKNVQVTSETVQLDARKAFLAYKQAESQLQIANEVVAAHQEAEKEAKDFAAALTAKSATAKSQLDLMKADLTFRLAQIKLLAAMNQR